MKLKSDAFRELIRMKFAKQGKFADEMGVPHGTLTNALCRGEWSEQKVRDAANLLRVPIGRIAVKP